MNFSMILIGCLLLVSPLSQASTAYTFISLDIGISSYAFGINNSGQVVGAGSGDGFEYTNGVYTNWPQDGAIHQDINNKGQITGNFGVERSYQNYVYSDGNYTVLTVPDAYFTCSNGINDAGSVVGTVMGASYLSGGYNRGYLYSDGNFTFFDGTNGGGVQFNGINNNGMIVGNAWGNRLYGEGFIYSNGIYSPIPTSEPVTFLHANGINDNGQVVGAYYNGSIPTRDTGLGSDVTHGFVYDGITFTTLDAPNAIHTVAMGINDLGQVVGYYHDIYDYPHGFLATPSAVPLPPAMTLFGSVLTCLVIFARKQKTSAI